ncbi:hypothetical protein J6590_024776 [Homalodisca vitripennis]|nr:hypothetical protein J6590_024776 [Homalodisca vitripennis]
MLKLAKDCPYRQGMVRGEVVGCYSMAGVFRCRISSILVVVICVTSLTVRETFSQVDWATVSNVANQCLRTHQHNDDLARSHPTGEGSKEVKLETYPT